MPRYLQVNSTLHHDNCTYNIIQKYFGDCIDFVIISNILMCADDNNIKPDSFVVSLISIQCLDAEILIMILRIKEQAPLLLILKNREVLNETLDI